VAVPSLSTATSDIHAIPSAALGSAIPIEEQPAATMDVSSAAEAPGPRARFTIDAAGLAANPLLGTVAPDAGRRFKVAPAEFNVFADQVYQGAPYPMRRNGAITALMIGAVAAITGVAVLTYANRPECGTNQLAGGCGYGTKVIGTAVLSGGIVGLFVGAVTW